VIAITSKPITAGGEGAKIVYVERRVTPPTKSEVE